MTLTQIFPDDTARARRTDDLTSHAAADSNRNRRWVMDTVMGLFAQHGPMTDAELTGKYFETPGIPDTHYESVRKRRSDLTAKNMVVATDETRPSPTGRQSRVYRLNVEEVTR